MKKFNKALWARKRTEELNKLGLTAKGTPKVRQWGGRPRTEDIPEVDEPQPDEFELDRKAAEWLAEVDNEQRVRPFESRSGSTLDPRGLGC